MTVDVFSVSLYKARVNKICRDIKKKKEEKKKARKQASKQARKILI